MLLNSLQLLKQRLKQILSSETHIVKLLSAFSPDAYMLSRQGWLAVLKPVRTSHWALLERCCSYRKPCPGSSRATEWCSCFLRPLRDWCAALLHSGVDPAWALRRRTGALGLHTQLFLMSKESLRITGAPRYSRHNAEDVPVALLHGGGNHF